MLGNSNPALSSAGWSCSKKEAKAWHMTLLGSADLPGTQEPGYESGPDPGLLLFPATLRNPDSSLITRLSSFLQSKGSDKSSSLPRSLQLPTKEAINPQAHGLAGGRSSCPAVSRSGGGGVQGRNSALPQRLGEEWRQPGKLHALCIPGIEH